MANGQRHWLTLAAACSNIFDVTMEIVEGKVDLSDEDEMDNLTATIGEALGEIVISIFDL